MNARCVAQTGIPPELLRRGIAEPSAMSDADQVIGLMQDIRELGVRLAVDDFGTGYQRRPLWLLRRSIRRFDLGFSGYFCLLMAPPIGPQIGGSAMSGKLGVIHHPQRYLSRRRRHFCAVVWRQEL